VRRSGGGGWGRERHASRACAGRALRRDDVLLPTISKSAGTLAETGRVGQGFAPLAIVVRNEMMGAIGRRTLWRKESVMEVWPRLGLETILTKACCIRREISIVSPEFGS